MVTPQDPDPRVITIAASPASDSWGFVGVVRVGDVDAYRTLSPYPSPSEAQQRASELLARAIGGLLAAAEWQAVMDAAGHVPLRRDLQMGLLQSGRNPVQTAAPVQGTQGDSQGQSSQADSA
jgi:hypothetical protein